jgi:broad specificity phosphatase PhoE
MTLKRRAVAALVACSLLFGSSGLASAADQVIFVVRHAERADGGAAAGGMMAPNDPPLSAAGIERARRLASLLASAGVKSIFTTEFTRTRQTAAPLAEAAQITPSAVSAKDAAALIQKVRAAAGNVLVVGHSNTVPELLKQLGVNTPITIGENEYDSLFVIVRPGVGEPTLIRLRY